MTCAFHYITIWHFINISYLTHPQALLESQAMTRWPPEPNTSNQYYYNHCNHLYQSLSETKGFWVLIDLDFSLQNLWVKWAMISCSFVSDKDWYNCNDLYQSLSETKGLWVLINLDFSLQNLWVKWAMFSCSFVSDKDWYNCNHLYQFYLKQ